MNLFTNFFSKSRRVSEHPQVKAQPFSIAGKSAYYITNDKDHFDEMMVFFKQFDLKNTQNWETSQKELSSFFDPKVLWKITTEPDENGSTLVREMPSDTLEFYKNIFVTYKPDVYIIDHNLTLNGLTSNEIPKCLYYAQKNFLDKETSYPSVVYLCTPGHKPDILVHSKMRHVMFNEKSSIPSLAPELYGVVCDILKSRKQPTLSRKKFTGA